MFFASLRLYVFASLRFLIEFQDEITPWLTAIRLGQSEISAAYEGVGYAPAGAVY
jgi:hypothetical protein